MGQAGIFVKKKIVMGRENYVHSAFNSQLSVSTKKCCTLSICFQWGSKIQPFEIWPFWRSDFKGWDYCYDPNHLKIRPFVTQTFWLGFQMVLEKLAAICPFFSNGWVFIFQTHSKSKFFANHLRSGLVRISDHHSSRNNNNDHSHVRHLGLSIIQVADTKE